MESHGPRGSPRRADGEGPRGPPGATAASRQEAAAAARTRGAARRLDLENTPKAGVTGPLYRVSGLQHPPGIPGFLERLASRGKRTLGGFWSSPGATLAAPPTLAGAHCDGGLLLQGHPGPRRATLNPASGSACFAPSSAWAPRTSPSRMGPLGPRSAPSSESSLGPTAPGTRKALPALSSQPSLPRTWQKLSVRSSGPSANDQYGNPPGLSQ